MLLQKHQIFQIKKRRKLIVNKEEVKFSCRFQNHRLSLIIDFQLRIQFNFQES